MNLPLEGLRVVDLSQYVAGPLCSMLLGDFGAEVIKVEEPGRGDGFRTGRPPLVKGESAHFFSVNRNKKSITVDLRQDEGQEIVRRLAQRSDVFLENFRPGVAEALGVGYEIIAQLNPRIVYCSVSAFGPTGPYRHKPGIDPILQAVGGLMSITGEPGRPMLVGVPLTDTMAAMLAFQGLMLGLWERERSGMGQQVGVNLLDATLQLLVPREQNYFVAGEVLQPMGSAYFASAPNQAFQSQDGSYIFIAGHFEKYWPRLCKLLGRPDLAQDPRFVTNDRRYAHRQELIPILEQIIRQRPAAEWLTLLEAEGIPSGPINTIDRVLTDPQVLHNEMVVELQHPAAGPIKVLGVPIKLRRTPGQIKSPPPVLGQHTQEVLSWLGYTAEQIAELRQKRVI